MPRSPTFLLSDHTEPVRLTALLTRTEDNPNAVGINYPKVSKFMLSLGTNMQIYVLNLFKICTTVIYSACQISYFRSFWILLSVYRDLRPGVDPGFHFWGGGGTFHCLVSVTRGREAPELEGQSPERCDWGVWGSVEAPLAGSGAEPRPPTILGHNQPNFCLKTGSFKAK